MTTSRFAAYGWIITRDYGAEEEAGESSMPSRVGTSGPYTIDPAIQAQLRDGEGVAFLLCSDDAGDGDHPDFEGRIIIDEAHDAINGEEEFGPLDDLGTPDVGSTTITYRNAAGDWIAI